MSLDRAASSRSESLFSGSSLEGTLFGVTNRADCPEVGEGVIITLECVIYFRSFGETTFGPDLTRPLVSSEYVVSPLVPVPRKSGLPIGG